MSQKEKKGTRREAYSPQKVVRRSPPCRTGDDGLGVCLLCLCARLFICALWSPAGKGLTSWLSFVVSAVSLSLSHWYPGSGVVLDCIDS